MDIPIQVFDNLGDPVTDLVKADVTLRDPDNSAIIYDYDSLSSHLGLGCYVIWGADFTDRPVRLYIEDVEQLWFGMQYAGVRSTKYVELTGNQTVAGVKTFSDKPIIPAPTANLNPATKKYVDDAYATCVKNDAAQTLTNQFTFNTNCPISSVTPTDATDIVNKAYVDNLLPYLEYQGKMVEGDARPQDCTLELLTNGLGSSVAITRIAEGIYGLSSTASFLKDPSTDQVYTQVFLTPQGTAPIFVSWDYDNTSLIKIYFFDSAGAALDAFGICDIIIRTYPGLGA